MDRGNEGKNVIKVAERRSLLVSLSLIKLRISVFQGRFRYEASFVRKIDRRASIEGVFRSNGLLTVDDFLLYV